MLVLRRLTRSTMVIAQLVALQPIQSCAAGALDYTQDVDCDALIRPDLAISVAFARTSPTCHLYDGAPAQAVNPSGVELSLDRRLATVAHQLGAVVSGWQQFYQNVQATGDVAMPRQMAASDLAYLERARALVRAKDIAAARLIFTRLANSGVAEAAFELGRTYDPDFLETIPLAGLKPDVEVAKRWYKRAAALGDADAKNRLAKFEERDTRQ